MVWYPRNRQGARLERPLLFGYSEESSRIMTISMLPVSGTNSAELIPLAADSVPSERAIDLEVGLINRPGINNVNC